MCSWLAINAWRAACLRLALLDQLLSALTMRGKLLIVGGQPCGFDASTLRAWFLVRDRAVDVSTSGFRGITHEVW